jgi:hypothetical protein
MTDVHQGKLCLNRQDRFYLILKNRIYFLFLLLMILTVEN